MSQELTAGELDLAFEQARHLYRALRQVGLVTTYDGEPPSGDDSSKGTDGGVHAVRTTCHSISEHHPRSHRARL